MGRLDGKTAAVTGAPPRTDGVTPFSVTFTFSREIQQFDLTEIRMPEVDFEVTCSKGTYIRSLAHDFGKAVGSGAYLTALCRTCIDDYRLEDAWELEELVTHIKSTNA